LVTTGAGVGYLPGYLPTYPVGYLPGYLPTGAGAGGGGSLRGRSAAAATLSMGKDAAVASTNFIMTIPLVSGTDIAFRKSRRSNRRGTPPFFPSPLSQSGFHRCTV